MQRRLGNKTFGQKMFGQQIRTFGQQHNIICAIRRLGEKRLGDICGTFDGLRENFLDGWATTEQFGRQRLGSHLYISIVMSLYKNANSSPTELMVS